MSDESKCSLTLSVERAEKDIIARRHIGDKDHHGFDIPIYEDYVRFHKGDPIVYVSLSSENGLARRVPPLSALYYVLEFFEHNDIDLRELSKVVKNLEEYKGVVDKVLSMMYEIHKYGREMMSLVEKVEHVIHDDDPKWAEKTHEQLGE